MTSTSDTDRPQGPVVFLSYAHDDEAHTAAVLNLASFLETRGMAVELDHWHNDGRQDWYAWMLRTIQAADFVLVVASPRYRAVADGFAPSDENRGVQAETAVLRDLLYRDRQTWLGRVLPVVLPGRSLDELPTFTQPYSASHFVIDAMTDEGVDELLRVLTGQPRYIRPPRGQVPTLPETKGEARIVEQVSIRRVLGALVGLLRKIRIPQLHGWAALTAGTTAGAIIVALFLFGFSWLTMLTVAVTGGLVLMMIQFFARDLSPQWKIVALAVTPLLAGVLVALPHGWDPLLDVTAGDSPHDSSANSPTARSSEMPDSSRSTKPSATRQTTQRSDSRQSGVDEPGGSGGDPASSADERDRSSSGGSGSRGGTIEILEVGHTFAPGIDRLTATIRNSHPEAVLVTQLSIYMDRPPGHGWSDGGESWHFTVPDNMQAADPGENGARRTHGLITMSGTSFSAPLVGQGYLDGAAFRRLLTFKPQKFLAGSATASIVIDIPTTMLLQSSTSAQPEGPMVEYELDPEGGSIFTYFELRTPEDQSYACDYLRRHENNPVCDDIDPLALVGLPH